MTESELFIKYFNINDIIKVYSNSDEGLIGTVQRIDDEFLVLALDTGLRYIRLNLISSFSVIKPFVPSEEIDRSVVHSGVITSYDPDKMLGRIWENTEGIGRRRFNFQRSDISLQQTELLHLLGTHNWGELQVDFHLGMSLGQPVARDISLKRIIRIEYREGVQKGEIRYYSNANKRGRLMVLDQNCEIDFYLNQVSDESLAYYLLFGRGIKQKVNFVFGYNNKGLVADQISPSTSLIELDTSDYQKGHITGRKRIGINHFAIQVTDETGVFDNIKTNRIEDYRLYQMVINEDYDYSSSPVAIIFQKVDNDLKGILLDQEMPEGIFSNLSPKIKCWKYISVPHEPALNLDKYPDDLLRKSIESLIKKALRISGQEDNVFELLEKYKNRLDSNFYVGAKVRLAIHSKRHDNVLFELLCNDDYPLEGEEDDALTLPLKRKRASNLENLRGAYYRCGNIERAQELDERIKHLRLNDITGLNHRCTSEIKKTEHLLKGLVCIVMPQIWNLIYLPLQDKDRSNFDWQVGFLYYPPTDYDIINKSKKKYESWIKARKKAGLDASLQSVLSLKDVISLIEHYWNEDWYDRWITAEHKTCFSVANREELPCFYRYFRYEDWERLKPAFQRIANSRDRNFHEDSENPRDISELEETIRITQSINALLEKLELT